LRSQARDRTPNRGIDPTTTYEVGLKAVNDWKQIEFAESKQRVFVSHDGDMIKLHKRGLSHHGIIYRKMNKKTFDEIIEGIVRVCESRDRDSMVRVLVNLGDLR
jgi:predicted nuclease of predicted toxin-antitoxin system